jgi:hypothetical protein
MDHIKAIAAVKDAHVDFYLNLKSHIHDGRLIYTYIRPGTAPGLSMTMTMTVCWIIGRQESSKHAMCKVVIIASFMLSP